MFTKSTLLKLTKQELIEIILNLNSQSQTPEERQITLSSVFENGAQKWKRWSLNVKIKGNLLNIYTTFLTPSGMGDNGMRDNYEKILTKSQLNYLGEHTTEEFMVKYFSFKKIISRPEMMTLKAEFLPYTKI